MHRRGGSRKTARFGSRSAALLVAGLAGMCGAAPAATAQTDNVLLVMIDDLGPEYVRCYQRVPAPPATPVLDQLAATGLRFENAVANPLCTPSRVCLQTGRHAWRAGTVVTLWPGDPGLDPAELLLPEVLLGASAGYGLAMVGKWHLGDRFGAQTPNAHGWPFFSGQMYGGLLDYYAWPKVRNGVASTSTVYATTDEVDESLAWIAAQPSGQPWLLLLCFHSPHGVHHAPPVNLHHQILQGLDPTVTPIPFYKAMIESVDAELGRLLQGLGAARARTNVLVFGDNGTPGEVNAFGLPPERCKGSLYRTGERIPFLANGPAVLQPGRVVHEDVHVLDVFPTVLELCGVDARTALPPGHVLDGHSLLPLLRGGTRTARPHYTENIGTGYGDGATMSGGGYKLIRFTDDRAVVAHEELYHVAADPLEAVDLLLQPLSPGRLWVYQQLSAAFRQLTRSGFSLSYGTGCPGHAGPWRLMVHQPPNLGTTVHMRVVSPAAAAPGPTLVVMGLSNEVSPSYGPLPRDLTSSGMPGCLMLADPMLALYVGPSDTFFSLVIPQDRLLIGLSLFLQAWVADPLANPSGRVTTAAQRLFLADG
ncbi:MAG: sulfatase-like hydrolase/transferase [Planctomycetota bacterium]